MEYKGFDLDKYLNGPNSKNGFKPPKFIYEKIDVSEKCRSESGASSALSATKAYSYNSDKYCCAPPALP